MKYCKNCRILYSSQAAACPKCGIAEPKREGGQEQPAPDKEEIRRDWIWLVIGVPILIGVIYLLILLLKSLGQ